MPRRPSKPVKTPALPENLVTHPAQLAACLEHLATAIRERHKRCPRPADDVGLSVDQTLATKVPEVAILHTAIPVLFAQIRRRTARGSVSQN